MKAPKLKGPREGSAALSGRRLLEDRASAAGALLLILALPRLAAINRFDGFDAGDRALTSLGRIVARCAHNRGIAARFAGAKLGLVVPAEDEEKALDIAADLFERVAEAGHDVHIGGAWSAYGSDATLKVNTALSSLDQSRGAGPRGVGVKIVGNGKQDDDISLAKEALAMIRAGASGIALQPVVDAQSPGRVLFREALIRLTRPNGKLITAGAFMPALTRMGMAEEADLAVLDFALDALTDDPGGRISVNVSAESLSSSTWRDRALNAALRVPEAVERLIVEVSEETALDHLGAAGDLFSLLRRFGVSLALDDFGAGRTSFSHLRDARFDMVKIDGSFIHAIDQSPRNQALVAALSDLARKFDMMVVAEYVETAQEARALRSLGVDGFQGFLFGRPTLVWSDGARTEAVHA